MVVLDIVIIRIFYTSVYLYLAKNKIMKMKRFFYFFCFLFLGREEEEEKTSTMTLFRFLFFCCALSSNVLQIVKSQKQMWGWRGVVGEGEETITFELFFKLNFCVFGMVFLPARIFVRSMLCTAVFLLLWSQQSSVYVWEFRLLVSHSHFVFVFCCIFVDFA